MEPSGDETHARQWEVFSFDVAVFADHEVLAQISDKFIQEDCFVYAHNI